MKVVRLFYLKLVAMATFFKQFEKLVKIEHLPTNTYHVVKKRDNWYNTSCDTLAPKIIKTRNA